MWIYRSEHLCKDKQIVLYEYKIKRKASHTREVMKVYNGICVIDGYQIYHTLEKELEKLTIASYWITTDIDLTMY